ncbi:hypothetical protein K523DRAFT_325785, partial [Schizophyllum commune Tattone D]
MRSITTSTPSNGLSGTPVPSLRMTTHMDSLRLCAPRRNEEAQHMQASIGPEGTSLPH